MKFSSLGEGLFLLRFAWGAAGQAGLTGNIYALLEEA
jgi:hypothetical protein